MTEENWRDAAAKVAAFRDLRDAALRRPRRRSARRRPGPRALERAVAVQRRLAQVYGFTDLDGSRPDAWRYLLEVQEAGKPADATGYR